jgi:hypothetical protein
VRSAVAYCIAIALLGMTSGLALVNCPFLVSAERPSCCHDTAPNKCPLSKAFDTCPYVALDSKIEHPHGRILASPPAPLGVNEPLVSPLRFEGKPVAWAPSLSDLHVRIRVLLI